jgi:N-acetylglucosaminyldiphosphoundecaprenol N-acetyl-beta-D-mannosaminyltransferase
VDLSGSSAASETQRRAGAAHAARATPGDGKLRGEANPAVTGDVAQGWTPSVNHAGAQLPVSTPNGNTAQIGADDREETRSELVTPTALEPWAHKTASIMGLPFHRLDHRTLTQHFLEGVRGRNGGWIVTPNLDILRQFTANPECRGLIRAASHRVADGQPLVWASRLSGTPLPERVPGSDLVLSLSEAASQAGVSVFLLGGNPGVAAAAAGRLQARYPGLHRVGSYCPPFGYEDDPEELDRIREALRSARPTLVLVGLGFPRQERLIDLLRSELPQTWFVGVGISLSFLAGEQPRAPAALQRLGLEWTHRLWHDPRRLFRRYVVHGLPFGLRLFTWALTQRLRMKR